MNQDYLYMTQMLSSYIISQSICAVAELNIADALLDGPLPIAQLAQQSGTKEGQLYRVMRCLASLGIFEEDEEQSFALNDKARCLCTQSPGSLKPWAQLVGQDWFRQVWSQLPQALASDECMFDVIHGQSVYTFLRANPQHFKLFQDAMATGTQQHTYDFLHGYDFSNKTSIVDLGGGDGSLLRALGDLYPQLERHLFELPEVLAAVPEDLLDGITVHAGSFFDDQLPTSDCLLLKWIVHNWNDDEVIHLLKNCRQALSANGRLLIYERIIPGANKPSESKLLDLNMMLMQGGRERNAEEFKYLLEQSGFALSNIHMTSTSMCIIEAV